MILNQNLINSKIKLLNKYNNSFNVINLNNGDITLKVSDSGCDFYLHSRYNPKIEGERFAQSKYSSCENILLYGLGLGYHIIPFIEKLKDNQKLYILECNFDIIKYSFENTNIKNYLSNKNVIFMGCDNINEILEFIKDILNKNNSEFIIHEPSLRIMPNYLKEVKEIINGYNIRVKSHIKFSKLTTENHNYNTKKNYLNGGKLFKDKYKNIPCIIVSAGPSLECNFEDLKNAYNKAIIIAVGRTAKFLEKNNISPDYYIQTDSQAKVMKHLEIKNNEIPLFMLSTASKELENYPGKKYILFEKNGACDDMKEFAVESGGSVATTAMSLSFLMGCNPIILIGQDLCYWSDILHSGETRKYSKLKTNKAIEGIDGNSYFTSNNLYEYLRWFERFINKHPERKYINCTAKGAKIHGMENKNSKEYIKNLPEINKKIT